MKRFDKQWIGQSLTTVSGSASRLQRCSKSWFLAYTYLSTSPVGVGMRQISSALNPSPTAWSVNQRYPLSTFHNCYETTLQHLLSPMQISVPSRVLSLASLLPSRLNASADGPSCPLCQITPWSQITIAVGISPSIRGKASDKKGSEMHNRCRKMWIQSTAVAKS